MEIILRLAGKGDASRLNGALAQLSVALGDDHCAVPEDLERAGLGESSILRAQLAERGTEVVGAALYSPVFSTRVGSTGVYVSDLWVAQTARRQGLAQRLLRTAMADGAGVWGATFLKLTVAQDNSAARAFYARIGFRPLEEDINMFIDAKALTGVEEKA